MANLTISTLEDPLEGKNCLNCGSALPEGESGKCPKCEAEFFDALLEDGDNRLELNDLTATLELFAEICKRREAPAERRPKFKKIVAGKHSEGGKDHALIMLIPYRRHMGV